MTSKTEMRMRESDEKCLVFRVRIQLNNNMTHCLHSTRLMGTNNFDTVFTEIW